MEKINIDNFWNWYDNLAVKYEIIKFLYNREFVLLTPSWKSIRKLNTRNLRCHSVQHFNFLLFKMLKVNVKKTVYNMYYSLAKFEDGIPFQSANLSERDNTEWNENYYNKIEKFDFMVDIDAGEFSDLDYAYETTGRIIELFDKLKIPYEVRFSGMGFHILIDGDYFKSPFTFNPHKENNIYQFYTALSKMLYEKYSELIDFKINDSRRVIKIPYSLALFEDDIYVCYPFSNRKDFGNFKLENMKPENLIDKIKMRGKFVFNKNLTKSLNIKAFNKLLD